MFQSNNFCAKVVWVLLGLAVVLSGTSVSAVDVLYPVPGSCNPAHQTGNHPREQGRLGILYQFRVDVNYGEIDEHPEWLGVDLDLSDATVRVQFELVDKSATVETIHPAPGEVGFVAIDRKDGDGKKDAIKIYYNGDFPAGKDITVTVTGAKAMFDSNLLSQSVTSDNEVTFKTGSADPRTPFSMELVFDSSGSMAWDAATGSSMSRMAVLKAAAQVLYFPSTQGGFLSQNAMLGDELGLVFFATSANAFDPTPEPSNLGPAHDLSMLDAIFNHLQGQYPHGWTSIGHGLRVAQSAGFADVADNNKIIILFSDGEQNTDPMVGIPDTDLLVGGDVFDTKIKIYTIVTGLQTGPTFDLQTQIAATTGGEYAYVEPNTSDPGTIS